MNNDLLLTKLHTPKPNPRIVERPRLLARLDEGLEEGCKLIVLSAPVGYGKSTLVSGWLAKINLPTAWLSLDAEDNDPVRFWSYIVAALQTVQPEIGQAAQALLRTAQSPATENILSDLINQIAALSQKIILVLDDYHLIELLEVHERLSFLLSHLPPQMRLIITTRQDPPLPLPQMRAKGQALELRAKDLRFTIDECGQFLKRLARVHLQEKDISALSQRTEGWAAGLQMAALSLRELDDPAAFIESFAGDNQYIADYLVTEVLNRQPQHIRDFLLQTSIVERFTPSLCDRLVGDPAGQSGELIKQIETLGLFVIPLDHVRQWYRYHKLFSDLLRYRLRHNDPAKFAALNRAASRWYDEHHLVEEAVKYALVGEDFDKAAELIEKSGLTVFGQNRFTALQHWINALPAKTIREHPYLSVLLVWVGALTGQNELAKRQLALAEENLSFANADLRSEITCHIALLRAYASRSSGDLDSSLEYAQAALRQLSKTNIFLDCTIYLNLGGNYWLKGDFLALEAPLKHAMSFADFPEVEYPALAATGFLTNAYLQQGRLQLAEVLCKKTVEHKNHHAHPAAAYVLLEQGELLYERNDLDKALKVLSRTIQIGESADKIVNLVRARQLLARVYYALGNHEEANSLMEQADEVANQFSLRYQVRYQIDYEYYRVRWLLLQHKLGPTLQWAEEYRKNRNPINNPWAALSELVYAQVLLADGKPEQALPTLRICEESARSLGAHGWVIQSLALQSLGHNAMNDLEKALESLRHALNLAEPEGYVRTFVDYSVPMRQLLTLARQRGIAVKYVGKLLEAFPAGDNLEGKKGRELVSTGQALSEPLTEQERSILRRMAAGLSHHEIAGELYLSINTVKWHTTHIYGKLGVHRRAHAVARAKEMGIL